MLYIAFVCNFLVDFFVQWVYLSKKNKTLKQDLLLTQTDGTTDRRTDKGTRTNGQTDTHRRSNRRTDRHRE